MQSSFNDVNWKCGVDGRPLHLEIKTDGDLPDKTKANVDEATSGLDDGDLLDSDGGIGTCFVAGA